MRIDVAELHIDDFDQPEMVTYRNILGDTDAPVDLDRRLCGSCPELADLDLACGNGSLPCVGVRVQT